MSTTHTPGPWTASPPTGYVNDLFTEQYYFIEGPGSDVHGHMNGHDASLIAAAPDMLAMLQEIEADTVQSLDAMKDDGIAPPAWFVAQHAKMKGVIARAVITTSPEAA